MSASFATASFPGTEFSVSGMTCNNCARHVTEAIQAVPGVASASVTLDSGRARVRWSPNATPDAGAVVRAIGEAGYGAKALTEESCHEPKSGWSPLTGWKFNAVVGSAATLPLLVGEWFFGLGMERWYHWTAFVLALPVQVLCGARFYRGAWNQLKTFSSNMDTLVALGSTTAFAYSAWGLFAGWHAHLYFMEAAAIITLISVGHWMEAIMSARAAGSLRALLHLAPEKARKLDAQGQETAVSVSELRRGDRVALRPGDRVPTDGVVVEGASAVDESMLTGESLPVEKARGAKVFAGTVNQDGSLVVQVEATGEQTALAHIIEVVQRAQNSRADIQKLGDQVSSVFVPVVVLIAIGTGLWWGLAYDQAMRVSEALMPYLWKAHLPETALAAAFIQVAAVLIVACPCAMGLATPAAIMAGTNVAARRGILIRDGLALEKSGTLTAVVFDKTGTLTQGKVAVAAVEDLRLPAGREPKVEQLAAALARPSNHPLSRAVATLTPQADPPPAPSKEGSGQSAVGRPLAQGHFPSSEGSGVGSSVETISLSVPDHLPLTAWQEHRGSGVQARLLGSHGAIAGATLRLGSFNWLRQSNVDLAVADRFVAEWSSQGATVLGLAADQRLIGLFALRDALKPHAGDVVAQLTRQGKTCFLITGDNPVTAAAIAAQAGIAVANVFAEVRPEQKADIIRQLQQRGERVAFVGDGINDAPALEQADLGIAVSRASDVAREAADVILLNSDIQAVPETLALARATLRTIKQNLFWAFFYNAAGIPLAALGFLSPILCAAAMGLSDLVVIGNALRLRRWRGRRG